METQLHAGIGSSLRQLCLQVLLFNFNVGSVDSCPDEPGREKSCAQTLNGKVRLNANENPYGPSEKGRQAVVQILSEANRYPFDAINDFKIFLQRKKACLPSTFTSVRDQEICYVRPEQPLELKDNELLPVTRLSPC